MYMGPITAARPPSGRTMRRIVGVPVLLVAGIVMIPWLAGNGLVAAFAIAGRATVRLPQLLVSAVDYAGEVAIGR